MKKHYLAITIAMMTSNAMLSNPAQAAAHLLPELGSLNASTAGAGSAALAESALTAWTNPAAMSQLENPELTVNLAGLYTDINYSDTNPTERFDSNIDAGGWAPVGASTLLPLSTTNFTLVLLWLLKVVRESIMVITFLGSVY